MRRFQAAIVAAALACGSAASSGGANVLEQEQDSLAGDRPSATWKSQAVIGPGHEVNQVTAVVAADRDVIGWNEGTTEFPSSDPSSGRADGRPGVYVAIRTRGARRFGRAHRLTKAPVSGFNLAAAADGTTLAAWSTADRKIQVAWRLPKSGWTDPKTLASRVQRLSGSRVSLALAPGGTGLISWLSGPVSNRAVEMAVVLGPGDIGPTQTLARGPGVTPVFEPAVAAADDGTGVVAWAGRCPTDGSPASPAMATTIRDGAVLGAPAAIPASECPTNDPDADIDAGGNALVLLNYLPFDAHLRAAFKSGSSEAFGPASRISDAGSSSSGSLAGSPSGPAVAVWTDSGGPGGAKQTAEAAWSAGDGIFGQPQAIGRLRGSVELAEAVSGDAIAVWQDPIPSLGITVRPLCVGGTVAAPLAISGRLSADHAALPDAAFTGSRALVAWGNPTRKEGFRGITAVSGPVSCGLN